MEKILPSGAKLVIGLAPFEDAIALHDGVLEALKGMPLPGSIKDWKDMETGPVKDALITAATSKAVRAAIFACARYCTYDGQKLDQGLFDDPKRAAAARQDYYTLAWEIGVANCRDFFVQTFSWLKTLLPTTASSPESK